MALPIVEHHGAPLVEVPDVDAVSARTAAGSAQIRGREQEDSPDHLVRHHAPERFSDVRDDLDLGQEGLLPPPVLAEGARNCLLAEGDPFSFHTVVLQDHLRSLGRPSPRLLEVRGVETVDVEYTQRRARARQQDEVVLLQPVELVVRRKRLSE